MFSSFLEIAERLNQIGITPLLMGSLGLEIRTGETFHPQDIDIHVPSDPRGWEAPDEGRIYQFDDLNQIMEDLGYGYHLVDRREHAFQKKTFRLSLVASIPSLSAQAYLQVEAQDGVSFYLPTLEQYLKI